MSATLVGELPLGVLNPAVELALAPAAAQLSGNLTAALALQASLSVAFPTLAMQLETLLTVTIPSLQAGIALGLPGITFSASAAAALVASAELELGKLQVLLNLLGGSVFVYRFSGGTVSTIGSDLASAITSTQPPGLISTDPVSGILIGASPGSWSTISPYFAGL